MKNLKNIAKKFEKIAVKKRMTKFRLARMNVEDFKFIFINSSFILIIFCIADDHVRNDEEADAIRKMVISKRKKLNKATVELINKRWTFEEGM